MPYTILLSSYHRKHFSSSFYIYLMLQLKVQFCVRFQVLTEVNMKFGVFRDVALCTLTGVYQRFRGACRLHRHDDGGSTHL
jgi:hypothetical protein